jgi:hypothetical protein
MTQRERAPGRHPFVTHQPQAGKHPEDSDADGAIDDVSDGLRTLAVAAAALGGSAARTSAANARESPQVVLPMMLAEDTFHHQAECMLP